MPAGTPGKSCKRGRFGKRYGVDLEAFYEVLGEWVRVKIVQEKGNWRETGEIRQQVTADTSEEYLTRPLHSCFLSGLLPSLRFFIYIFSESDNALAKSCTVLAMSLF